MARRCQLTGKGPQSGHNVSHSNVKTNRRFEPNLQKSTFFSDALRRKVRSENTRDLFNMLVALVWQIAMFISVVTLVMHKWTAMTVAMVITTVFSLVLYVSWYRHLPTTGTGDEESE